MKKVKLDHWFIDKNGFSASLLYYFVKIDMNNIGNVINYKLTLFYDSKEILDLDFNTLEDAMFFTEEVINKTSDINEIINIYNEWKRNFVTSLEIMKKRELINQKQQDIIEKVHKLDDEVKKIIDSCPHEVVFKYFENYPRKMVDGGSFYCPCCGCVKSFNSKLFNKSKVIDLTELSLIGNNEVLSVIKNEVIDNYELYYSKNDNSDILEEKMKKILVNYQYDYSDFSKKLTKNKEV